MAHSWTRDEQVELAMLWHVSATALAKKGFDPKSNKGVYERKIWAAEEMHNRHPLTISSTAAYKELSKTH